MISFTIEPGLILAGILFLIGLVGVLVRRNVIFMLLSLEIMFNATGLAFVTAGSFWNQTEGQVMFIFILAVAAAEVAIGLALILLIFKKYKILDIDRLSNLKG